jgi:hypothetical protein
MITGSSAGQIISLQKSSPFVPHGLHSLFAGFRTIHPSVVFFCHTFAIHPSFTVMFYKTTVSIHPQEAKKMRQKKTTQSYYT